MKLDSKKYTYLKEVMGDLIKKYSYEEYDFLNEKQRLIITEKMKEFYEMIIEEYIPSLIEDFEEHLIDLIHDNSLEDKEEINKVFDEYLKEIMY